MPLFKMCSMQRRDKKISVCGDSIAIIREKGMHKLNISGPPASFILYDDTDGSIIDDDDSLIALADFASSKGTILLLTIHNGPWMPPSQDASSVDVPSIDAPSAITFDQQIEVTSTPPSTATEYDISLRPLVSELKNALKAPASLKNKAIMKGKRSVVKSLANHLKRKPTSPGDIRRLCQRIHDSCPEAFIVSMRDTVVSSCLNQFVKSVYNATGYARETDLLCEGTPRRTRHAESDSDPDNPTEERVPHLCLDSNGCHEGMYSPVVSDEDAILFEELRVALVQHSSMPAFDEDSNVLRDFKLTYPLQRKFINKARTLSDWCQVFASWPTLKKQAHFLAHANLLFGKDILNVWLEEMADLQPLHAFMNEYSLNLKKNPATKDNSQVIEKYLQDSIIAQETSQSRRPLAIAAYPLIVNYFKEREDLLFLIVDANSTQEHIFEKVKEVSDCPILIIKGLSLLDIHATTVVAVRGMLLIEVNGVIEGILVVLAAYFVFNITYPKKLVRTLEFLQRIFLKVNPSAMGRFEGGRSKRAINAMVVRLAGQLADYEAKLSRWAV